MMELSDVVNAHFAFPVVGVVLCAMLVFAFGFKSPAEPPSFEALDDNEKKTKKSKQKKQTHADKVRYDRMLIFELSSTVVCVFV